MRFIIQVFQYDQNYIYKTDVILEESENGKINIPENCTDIKPPDGLYKAKFYIKQKVWKESATQEYIDTLKPKPPEPSELDTLKKNYSDFVYQLIMDGVI